MHVCMVCCDQLQTEQHINILTQKMWNITTVPNPLLLRWKTRSNYEHETFTLSFANLLNLMWKTCLILNYFIFWIIFFWIKYSIKRKHHISLNLIEKLKLFEWKIAKLCFLNLAHELNSVLTLFREIGKLFWII